jgi:ribosomal protein S18 acetylase RimI-like enzyme
MAAQLPPDYTILTATPSIETYCHLRIISGLSPKTPESAAIGLPNSMFSVQIQHVPSSTIVGMGRVVGDGAMHVQIVDIAVDPSHQKKGLGKAVMKELMKWLEENMRDDAYVSLGADGDAKYLYQKFGFKETAPATVMMGWMRGSQ